MRKCLGAMLVALLVPVSVFAEDATDVFGFQKFFKTKDGSYSWDSRHWADGNARLFDNWTGDAKDPTQWTDDRSSDGGGFYVDGAGVMQMMGDGPRFHINGQQSWAEHKQKFLNVEYTAYFKRNALGGKDYGGMVVGVRSGALGHGSSGGNNCDAHTYYARFRNDGKWDFEKEWKHPDSYYRSTSGVGHQDPLWGSAVLPVDKWIGMKYIVYNKDASTVHLEVYIDSTTNATPPGKWELVGVAEDAGQDWSGAAYGAATIDGCSYSDAKAAILQAGDAIVMRSDNDHPYYKFVSVREIDPTALFEQDEDGSSSSQGSSSSASNLDYSSSSENLGPSSSSVNFTSSSSAMYPDYSSSSMNYGPNSSTSSLDFSSSSVNPVPSSSSKEPVPTAIRRTYRPSLENVPVRHFDLLGRPAEKDAPQRIYGK
ncbi:MAG: hypothetical protein IKS02_07360 [Fibrobacter sp.]|nr:hypothetical protein [Fibrobacter sp.]